MCLEREMNSFLVREEEERKERKVHHPISLKENKEGKIDFTRMTKEEQDSFSLCEEEEEELQRKEESIKREVNGENNQHPKNSEKESEETTEK